MDIDKNSADTGQAIINVKQRNYDPFLIRAPFVKQDENSPDTGGKRYSRGTAANRCVCVPLRNQYRGSGGCTVCG